MPTRSPTPPPGWGVMRRCGNQPIRLYGRRYGYTIECIYETDTPTSTLSPRQSTCGRRNRTRQPHETRVLLRDAVRSRCEDYDYIFIDCLCHPGADYHQRPDRRRFGPGAGAVSSSRWKVYPGSARPSNWCRPSSTRLENRRRLLSMYDSRLRLKCNIVVEVRELFKVLSIPSSIEIPNWGSAQPSSAGGYDQRQQPGQHQLSQPCQEFLKNNNDKIKPKRGRV